MNHASCSYITNSSGELCLEVNVQNSDHDVSVILGAEDAIEFAQDVREKVSRLVEASKILKGKK